MPRDTSIRELLAKIEVNSNLNSWSKLRDSTDPRVAHRFQYVDAIDDDKYWTYAAVACMNAGGIRTDIGPTEITYGDLIMVQPFGNTWDILELTGDTIKKVGLDSSS